MTNVRKLVIVEIDESDERPIFFIKKQISDGAGNKMDVGLGEKCMTVNDASLAVGEMIDQWLKIEKIPLL